MNISKVEDFVAYNMAKDLMKQVAGDGMEFELMYQAIIDSMQEDKGQTEGAMGIASMYSSERGSNLKLDNIPLLVKGQNNGQVYGIEPISYSIYKKDSINSLIENTIGNIKNSSTANIEEIKNAVEKYSSKYGVDSNLVLAIIKQESNFDPNAESYAGAKGLMQLMDFNSEAYGVTNPFDVNQNIEAGVKHIKSYLDMFKGNLEMALMAYNGGPGTMERRGVKVPSDLYKMPKETQNYVPKVINYYKNGF